MRFISSMCALSVAAAASLLAGDAHADNWSGWAKIGYLEAQPNGFIVYPIGLPANPTNNPAGCSFGLDPNMTVLTFYPPSTMTLETREVVRQMLISAFLSGRKVKFWVESNSASCGQQGIPQSAGYYSVMVGD